MSEMSPSNWISLSAALFAFAASIWANVNSLLALKNAHRQSLLALKNARSLSQLALKNARSLQGADLDRERIRILQKLLAEFFSLSAGRIERLATNQQLKDQRTKSEITTANAEITKTIDKNAARINADFERCRLLRVSVELMLDDDDPLHKKLVDSMWSLLTQDPTNENQTATTLYAKAVLKVELDKVREILEST